MFRSIFLLLSLIALWCGVSYFTPATLYFEDSGEFIISAFFLDIAHPAGFPLYSQLANLFALLPLGPIAWRVNLFSSFLALLCAALCGLIVFKLAVEVFKSTKGKATILATVPALFLFMVPSFIKQAYTAEVYLLNCLLLELLLFLYLQFHLRKDLRYLLAASFLAGLGIGNHVAILFSLLPASLLLIFDFKKIKVVALPALLLFFFGIFIYSYIPVRATVSPPLNTGSAITKIRFLNLVTDKRDRALRPQTMHNAFSKEGISFLKIITNAKKDFTKILNESSKMSLALALIGLLVLCRYQPKITLFLLSVSLANWFFFQGWTPDPWAPLLILIVIACLGWMGWVYGLFEKFSRSLRAYMSFVMLVVIANLLISLRPLPVALYKSFANLDLPAVIGEAQLKGLRPHAVKVTESSWFILKYLQAVEGYRDDVTLVYLPQLLYPAYFAAFTLERNENDRFTSKLRSEDELNPDMKNFSAFVDFVSSQQALVFEASMSINEALKDIALLEADGYSRIRRSENGTFSPLYAEKAETDLRYIQKAIKELPHQLKKQAFKYLETAITEKADLLRQVERLNEAVSLLSLLCNTENLSCSAISLNNLAVYFMELGNFAAAKQHLEEIIKTAKVVPPAVRQNLAFVNSKL